MANEKSEAIMLRQEGERERGVGKFSWHSCLKTLCTPTRITSYRRSNYFSHPQKKVEKLPYQIDLIVISRTLSSTMYSTIPINTALYILSEDICYIDSHLSLFYSINNDN